MPRKNYFSEDFFMKNRRIVFTAITLIAVMLVATFAFTACTDGKGKGDVTVVIACDGSNKEYYVAADKVEGEGVLAVMEYLRDNEGLHFVTEDGGYGEYATEVGGFKQGDGVYIYIFTSVEKDFDVSEYKQTVDYKGVTLTSSGVGLSAMSVEEDAIIYFGTTTY